MRVARQKERHSKALRSKMAEEWELKCTELEIEFEEFKATSTELEESLQAEIEDGADALADLTKRLDAATKETAKNKAELEKFKETYKRENQSTDVRLERLQAELAKVTSKSTKLASRARLLEQQNDDLERQSRLMEQDKCDLSERLEVAVEDYFLVQGELEDTSFKVDELSNDNMEMREKLEKQTQESKMFFERNQILQKQVDKLRNDVAGASAKTSNRVSPHTILENVPENRDASLRSDSDSDIVCERLENKVHNDKRLGIPRTSDTELETETIKPRIRSFANAADAFDCDERVSTSRLALTASLTQIKNRSVSVGVEGSPRNSLENKKKKSKSVMNPKLPANLNLGDLNLGELSSRRERASRKETGGNSSKMEGFICVECLAQFPSASRLKDHFAKKHSPKLETPRSNRSRQRKMTIMDEFVEAKGEEESERLKTKNEGFLMELSSRRWWKSSSRQWKRKLFCLDDKTHMLSVSLVDSYSKGRTQLTNYLLSGAEVITNEELSDTKGKDTKGVFQIKPLRNKKITLKAASQPIYNHWITQLKLHAKAKISQYSRLEGYLRLLSCTGDLGEDMTRYSIFFSEARRTRFLANLMMMEVGVRNKGKKKSGFGFSLKSCKRGSSTTSANTSNASLKRTSLYSIPDTDTPVMYRGNTVDSVRPIEEDNLSRLPRNLIDMNYKCGWDNTYFMITGTTFKYFGQSTVEFVGVEDMTVLELGRDDPALSLTPPIKGYPFALQYSHRKAAIRANAVRRERSDPERESSIVRLSEQPEEFGFGDDEAGYIILVAPTEDARCCWVEALRDVQAN